MKQGDCNKSSLPVESLFCYVRTAIIVCENISTLSARRKNVFLWAIEDTKRSEKLGIYPQFISLIDSLGCFSALFA
jgi:hypothetical protein